MAYFIRIANIIVKSKSRWRTPLQATGYVRATDQNSVKEDNDPNR